MIKFLVRQTIKCDFIIPTVYCSWNYILKAVKCKFFSLRKQLSE